MPRIVWLAASSFLPVLMLGALLLGGRCDGTLHMVEALSPGAVPTSVFAERLESDDDAVVREALAVLTRRADPAAAERAVELLASDDDYVWLNAALYLGACGREEAVPYLIKALRHTAWRSDSKTLGHLKALTGEEPGETFEEWHRWWLENHRETPAGFDWTSSLGFQSRLPQAATPPTP